MCSFRSNRLTWNHVFTFIALLWIICFSACGKNDQQERTGGVVFKAAFTDPGSDSNYTRAAADIDVCNEYGIQTIHAIVIGPDEKTVGEGTWPCNLEGHRGTIDNIQPGTEYRIVVEGNVDDTVAWHGEIEGISVAAGLATDAGIVEMIRVGQFPIRASATGGGSIAPSGTVGVDPDGSQTFTITPEPNFQIIDVAVDGNSVGAPETYTFTGVNEAHTIQATFAALTNSVTVSAGTGGSIDPSGVLSVDFGGSLTFNITADPGFYLSDLLVNGSSVALQNPFTLDNISAATTIQALFSPVVFVDAAAPGGGDGGSWTQAFNNLQAAVNAASDGEDIWMKSGTYTLSSQVGIDKPVTIYGGFQGNESMLPDRDPVQNATIIDGNLATRCLLITANAVLDGLTIQNGRHTTGTNGRGGGAYIDNADPHLVDCTLFNNALGVTATSARGGAVYINGGSPAFDNCRFRSNLTSDAGQPSEGGAIFNNGGFPAINNCTFVDNRALGNESAAGAIYNNGGNATIMGCAFTGNYAGPNSSARGGAIFNNGGMHTISGSDFQGNLAEGLSLADGGAIYNSSASLTLTNSIFLENEARRNSEARGGAMFNNDSDPFITNCTFYANRAVSTVDHLAWAGAIFNLDGRPTIVNSIVWGNTADQGIAIFDEGTSLTGINNSDTDMSGPGGNGNIDADPLLDAQGHLRPGSPCIDAGDDAAAPDTDIDGETRPQGSHSDMGADEHVDRDGDTMPDYWEMAYGLDAGSDDWAADLDGDGTTNGFEYRFDLDPSQINPVLNASQRGNYRDNGDHDQNDDSTPAGRLAGTTHRAYFTFPLTGLSKNVTAAILRLEVVDYQSLDSSNDLDLYDVTTDPVTLEQSGSGKTGVFDDLGTGKRYVQLAVTSGDVGKMLEIPLPQSALSDINALRGGSFSVGLHLNVFGVVGTEFITFSTGTETRVHQLVLRTE